MSENELTETITFPENIKKTSPRPPKTDSPKEWEAYLKEMGLAVDRGKDPQEITLSALARFGKKNRPPDYNHENDLYIGNTPELYDEDAVQCDARIGADVARQKPEEFKKFFKKSLARQSKKR
jgi:hypothetical protein